jgi:hypothetical protein
MFVNEFNNNEQILLLNFLQKHIVMIVSDVVRGRGRFSAEWVLVINKTDTCNRWILISINEAIGIYLGDCRVKVSNSGNIHLGTITLQRKGGDKGAESANMLQFKADPTILFTDETSPNSSYFFSQ